MTRAKTKIAIVYDFDRTLSTSEMQDSFIESLGIKPKEFWDENAKFAKENGMDKILAYLYLMISKSKELHKPINRKLLKEIGSEIEFYKGVEGWFDLVDEIAKQYGVSIEHFVISSGLKEIIEGTPIYKKFKRVYACEYYYDENDNPVWLKNVINFTSKTQFLFRINKGELDIFDDKGVNQYVPHEERPLPFENMIYIGDGDTDIPCMKLVNQYGGHSIAVYAKKKQKVRELMYDNRINHYCKADYSRGSELHELIARIVHQISVESPLRNDSYRQYKESEKEIQGKMMIDEITE